MVHNQIIMWNQNILEFLKFPLTLLVTYSMFHHQPPIISLSITFMLVTLIQHLSFFSLRPLFAFIQPPEPPIPSWKMPQRKHIDFSLRLCGCCAGFGWKNSRLILRERAREWLKSRDGGMCRQKAVKKKEKKPRVATKAKKRLLLLCPFYSSFISFSLSAAHSLALI